MANRIIYQSDALYASSGVNSRRQEHHKQLKRIQSANYSFNVNRTDVNQFGQLARIDSTILETPTVSVDLTYLLGNGFNEAALGFSESSGESTLTGFIANQISATSSQGTSGINLYVLTHPEGQDANIARASGVQINGQVADEGLSTIGLGNCYLSDYTLDASVGDFPTVTVSMEGLNANATTGISGLTGDRKAAAANLKFNVPDGKEGGANFEDKPALTGLITGYFPISGVGVDVVNGTQLSEFNPTIDAGTGAVAAGTSFGFSDVHNPPGGASTLIASGAEFTGMLYSISGGVTLPEASPSTDGGEPIALKPGDMTLTLDNDKSFFDIGTDTSAGHIQSVSLSVPLSRTPIEKLGSTFAFARVADFPITPTLSVSAVINSTQQRALHDIIQDDGFIPELRLKFNNATGLATAQYILKNAKVESESVSSSIGPNKTVDLTFSVTIGGPNDQDNNVFFSGFNTSTAEVANFAKNGNKAFSHGNEGVAGLL